MAAGLSSEWPPFTWVILGQACPLPVVPPDKVAFDKYGGGWCAGCSHLWSADSVFAFRTWELGRLPLGLGWGRLRWERR